MQEIVERVPDSYQEEDAPRERSPYEEECEEDWSRSRHWYYNVVPLGSRGNVTRCGRETLKVCVVHVHNILKWDSACTELCRMYKT